MAIIDIFKKDAKDQTSAKPEAAGKKTAKSKKAKTAKTDANIAAMPIAKGAKPGKKAIAAARVLKSPLITEKASRMAEENWYAFKVNKSANKNEIARTVGDYYGVDVVAVNIVNIPEKRVRRGKGFSVKAGYKKAFAKIKEGQKIEILPK